MTTELRIRGRVLALYASASLVQRQLAGEDLPYDASLELADNVSTDEMTPAYACYYFDERLAHYCLAGFRSGVIAEGAVQQGGFGVLVGGRRFGCGSSRETAPYAQLTAGIRLVVAKSFERIYRQNCHNLGLFTSTDFGLLPRIERGESIPVDELLEGLDPLTREILFAGGLFAHGRARSNRAGAKPRSSAPRPRTIAEKIIAAHLGAGSEGEPEIGDALFVRADLRFSHEYVTPMADALFRGAFGDDARVTEPSSVLLFRDHLTFVAEVLARDPRKLPLLDQARLLPRVQEEFAARHGIRLLGETVSDGVRGSHAICHNEMVEAVVLPGQLVAGTDSHTCTAGAVGAFAFGVGSTDMASAFFTREVRLSVPESLRLTLRGRLRSGATAKDVMLHLFRLPELTGGVAVGRVLEIGGPGAAAMPLDELATLCNMAVEAGAFTGVVELDDARLVELAALRSVSVDALRPLVVRPDPGAAYRLSLDVDLALVEPMIALPGDPKNAVPLSLLGQKLGGAVRIDIAYGGTCTGGKREDMDAYAAVLSRARERGLRVAPGVEFFLQVGSQRVLEHARKRGYLSLFEEAGATLLGPACGACIGAGPGTSRRESDVSVSAGSRNFPRRSGPGAVYLANPYVVAASAIAGYIAGPDTMFEGVSP
jgi:3-isopropylmalate/(R)-2-methylmalate dehydratase large subunit